MYEEGGGHDEGGGDDEGSGGGGHRLRRLFSFRMSVVSWVVVLPVEIGRVFWP